MPRLRCGLCAHFLQHSRGVGRGWFLHESARSRVRVRARGVLLGILGGGVWPGSQNADPISDQKLSLPHPFSDLASKTYTVFRPGARFSKAPIINGPVNTN